jgi:hypothetical protein
MFEYISSICNFLNNLKGYITRDELITIISIYLGGEIDNHIISKVITERDIKRVSDTIECDDEFNCYELIQDISNRVVKESERYV